jgi:hypothetical protein
VPPRSRTARGATFSGNLLAVPTPLPDDDEQEPVGEREPANEAPRPLREALPAQESETAAEDRPAATEDPTPNGAGEQTVQIRPGRDRAPGTLRIDGRAGEPLWQAYIEAKSVDPFLSYRQFASGIVLDGLAVHKRRQKRSS